MSQLIFSVTEFGSGGEGDSNEQIAAGGDAVAVVVIGFAAAAVVVA